jgi:hypothetical protein
MEFSHAILNQMFKSYFKVEEIGTCKKLGHDIFLKGRDNSIFRREKELIRKMFAPIGDYLTEVISLTEGNVHGETEFIRNLFELAEDGIKEMKITRSGKTLKDYHISSNLTFLDDSYFSGVVPQYGLLHSLVSKGIGNDLEIFCDEDLDQYPEITYEYLIRNNFVKYKKIGEIEFRDRPEVQVDEKAYEKLVFHRVLMKDSVIPDSITYERSHEKTPREVGFSFPWNKAAFEKVVKEPSFQEHMRKNRITVATVKNPDNPDWIEDSMSIINHFIKKAGIEVDSIYVDGNIRDYRPNNVLRYNPKNAIIILKRNGEKTVTPADGDQAITLSYLNSRDIWFRDSTKAYVR